MAHSTSLSQQRGSAPVCATVVLAAWRLRQSGLLLLLSGVGIVASIMLVCALPLFIQVSTTAGLRNIINATPETSYITLHTSLRAISIDNFNQVDTTLPTTFTDALGPYTSGAPYDSIQASDLPLLSPKLLAGGDLRFVGESMNLANAHLKLVQGRLPTTCLGSPCPSTLEAAITPQTAQDLQVGVGSDLKTLMVSYKRAPGLPGDDTLSQTLTIHIVGIVVPTLGTDAFWQDNDLNKIIRNREPTLYQVLVSNESLLSIMTQAATWAGTDGLFLVKQSDVFWYYHLDASRISVTQINDLLGQFDQLQTQLAAHYSDYNQFLPPYLAATFMLGPMLGDQQVSSPLDRYRSRLTIVQIPVALLTLQVLFLVLFFIGLMAELLVERQSAAIAILRSRGASRQQIFGALATQGLGLGLLALLLGPALAIALVYLLAPHMLPPQGLGALNTISRDPLQVLFALRWYALAAAVVAVGAMLFSLYRATSLDVLAMRRESARQTRRPFWQRLNLDIFSALIALTGYGVSEYLIRSGALDPRSDVLISTPLNLVAPLFLVIAGMLLFLRFLPLLLRFSSTLAIRSRGAAPMLALAQMARSPGQFVRMTLLLAFAIAFAMFTLVFTASQSQRTLDIASYQVGADFSGDIANVPAVNTPSVAQETSLYSHVPGVLAASPGYMDEVNTPGTTNILSVRLLAVDPASFGQAADWSSRYSQASLPSLLAQLAAHHVAAPANATTPIPAIVDASLWDALSLSPGAHFSLDMPGKGTLPYVALARIQDIPSLKSSRVLPAAVLVDYASYAAVYTRAIGSPPPLNHVWLRTRGDAAALSSVRAALNSSALQLSPLYDRRALLAGLQGDPLYLALLGILSIGAVTTLVLALVGNLLASWLSARARLTNFTILRALGTAPGQVASVALWEQSIVYASSLFLGVVFGLFLVFTVIPSLVFTSIPDTGLTAQTNNTAFFTLQNLLPTQLVFPPVLGLILLVILLICGAALGLMVRTVSRLSIGQVLRLNED